MIDETSLLEYIHLKRIRYYNEWVQMNNNLVRRQPDEVDYLELIILKTRIEEFDFISEEIYGIIKSLGNELT